VITYLAPGLRFFQQGQFQGRTKHISPHLCREPDEPVNRELERFYDALLAVLRSPVARDGRWQLLECRAAWDGNWTCDCFVAFAWEGPGGERRLVAVNYADNQSQCHVRLPFADLGGKTWRLRDLLSPAAYDRNGDGLEGTGLFLDMKPMSYHAFEVSPIS
jgi:hypothetical protein